jgi:hypothetical protein
MRRKRPATGFDRSAIDAYRASPRHRRSWPLDEPGAETASGQTPIGLCEAPQQRQKVAAAVRKICFISATLAPIGGDRPLIFLIFLARTYAHVRAAAELIGLKSFANIS